jgi:hypothetical protein
MRKIEIRFASPGWRASRVLRIALAATLLCLPPEQSASAADVEDSCVDCHRNPDFLVQNKKLYDYFLDWQLSVHREYEVSCSDCHGGNPELADKKKAHGAEVGEEQQASAVNFKNIPDTCGQCHDDFHDAYLESNHFEHLVKAKQEKQGPNCVTCHGSMNTTVLDVTTVEAACARCHNEETDNHPEIPNDARLILNKFLSIDRFYRYMTHRLEPDAKKAFFEDADPRIEALAVRWHTFDLEKIEEETRELVDFMKQKREALGKKKKPKKEKQAGP